MSGLSPWPHLALFGERGFTFHIPQDEACVCPGHIEQLLKSARALQMMLTAAIEEVDDSDVDDVLNAHIGVTFITSMAYEMMFAVNAASKRRAQP
jgi:hypothetical protein